MNFVMAGNSIITAVFASSWLAVGYASVSEPGVAAEMPHASGTDTAAWVVMRLTIGLLVVAIINCVWVGIQTGVMVMTWWDGRKERARNAATPTTPSRAATIAQAITAARAIADALNAATAASAPTAATAAAAAATAAADAAAVAPAAAIA